MSDDQNGKQPKPISVSVGVGVESNVGSQSITTAGMETRAVRVGGLDDLTDEQASDFYRRSLDSLPATRVRGFYGVVDGGPDREGDVALLMYDSDKMRPTLRLTLSRDDLVRFSDALADLVSARFRHV